MELNETQKQSIKQWVGEGRTLSEIQTLIREEFDLSMTYMDVRFLVLDLGVNVQDKPEPKPAATGLDEGGKVLIVLDGDEAGGVGPTLEQAAVGIEQRIEVGWIVEADAAEHHQIVAPGHYIHAVQLQEANATDRLQKGALVR